MRKSVFQLLCGITVLAVITLSFTLSSDHFGLGKRLVFAQTDKMEPVGSPVPFTILQSFMSPKAVGRDGSGLPEGINLNNIAPGTAVTVSQASYFGGQIALSSLVAGFGEGVSNVVAAAASPGQTNLGGVTVKCTDWFGVEADSLITYVNPTQVNHKIPDNLGQGPAQCTYNNTLSGRSFTSNFELVPVAPGIYAANATGSGVPAGLAGRVRGNVNIRYDPLARLENCSIVPVPVDLDPSTDTIYLGMLGTGFRFRSSSTAATVKVGGVDCPLTFVGQKPDEPWADLLQCRLPRSLIGRGWIPIEWTVDGIPGNTMHILIK
jgi:uncharacterized protein (TIGR03437 family)